MHDITTQVLGTEAVPSKDGSSIRHVVNLVGGQAADGIQFPAEGYVTFDAGLGGKAQGFNNQAVDARVEIKLVPKASGSGHWTNYVLHDIAPVGMLPPLPMPAAGGTNATAIPTPAVAQPVAQTPVAVEPVVHPLLTGQAERDAQELRRSVMHATLEFSGRVFQGSGEAQTAEAVAVALAKSFTTFISTGSFDSPRVADVTPATPEEIAAQVPGVEVGAAGLPWNAEQA